MNYGIQYTSSTIAYCGLLCRRAVLGAVIGGCTLGGLNVVDMVFRNWSVTRASWSDIAPRLSPISTAHAYKVRRECETVQKTFGPYDYCRTVFVVPAAGDKSWAEQILERREEEKRLTTDCIKSKMEQEAMAPEKRSPPTPTCESVLRRANGKTWTAF